MECTATDTCGLLNATCTKDLEGVEFLMNRRGADRSDGDIYIYLSLSAVCGNLKNVKFLVDTAGANIETRDVDGQTPLSLAAVYGHVKVVKFLVNRGADIEIGDNGSDTPLLYATMRGHLQIAEFLKEVAAQRKIRKPA